VSSLQSSPTYRTWASMLTRCRNSRRSEWKNYGGRGIKVCERWLKFENFLADMGERPLGTSIDRIDNDKGYEPGNCRWASSHEQNTNRRDSRHYMWRGKMLPLKVLAKLSPVSYRTLVDRLDAGMTIEEAMSTPRNSHFKLTDEDVEGIHRRHAAGETQVAIAKEYGVSNVMIGRILRGLSRKRGAA
jgi:hypothetical protein